MPFLNSDQIAKIGFRHIGENVLISSMATFDKPHQISIDDNSRIDDFCALSGNVTIGKNVHVAVMNVIVGSREPIVLEDFSGLAFGCRLFSASDDYSGNSLTNPTVPNEFKNINHGKIIIGRHVIIGTNTVIFPGVHIAEGCSVGANSLLNKSTEPWGVYIGSPARRIRERSKQLLELEIQLRIKD